MTRSPTRKAATIAVAAALCADVASAVTVDGLLDPEYGAALSTQTTQTSFTNANPSLSSDPLRHANGSELDALYARVTGGVLYLLLAGNLGSCCADRYEHREVLSLFLDVEPGGQPTLLSDNPFAGCCAGTALVALTGLTFDAGFEPDYWLSCSADMVSGFAELPTGGRGQGTTLGANPIGAPGTLTGGTNPFGILAAVNNTNGAGVGMGCQAGSGAGVTTGVEWAIPLSAIGNPSGCFEVSVLIADAMTFEVGNQTLGPLPPGTCALGDPAQVNLARQPGNQYLTVCPEGSEARNATWGEIKTIYR